MAQSRRSRLRMGPHGSPEPMSLRWSLTQQTLRPREKLITGLSEILLAEQLTEWAYRKLPIKNTLTAGDAQLIEEAFQARLQALSGSEVSAGEPVHNGGSSLPPPCAPAENLKDESNQLSKMLMISMIPAVSQGDTSPRACFGSGSRGGIVIKHTSNSSPRRPGLRSSPVRSAPSWVRTNHGRSVAR
jgi:hypothetical protein